MLIMNPTATTCIETSGLMPNIEQAIGISNKDPPTTPDAPHAANVETTHKTIAIGIETDIPRVWQATRVMTVIVIAAPLVLIVEPNGIVMEKKSLSKPSLSHKCILIGMLAAELLEKNAVTPLSLKHVNTNGYGLRLKNKNEINGLTINPTTTIQITIRNIN